MEETSKLDRVYEYRQFSVGERIRIRLSPECKWPHDPWQDGHPGLVDHFYRGSIPGENEGHRVAVHLAGDFSGPDGVGPGGLPRFTFFAANELEPLEPVAQPPDRAGE